MCFLTKKIDDDKKNYLYDKLSCQTFNVKSKFYYLRFTNSLKLEVFLCFLMILVQNSSFFSKTCKLLSCFSLNSKIPSFTVSFLGFQVLWQLCI